MMGSTFQLALCLGMLALCIASPVTNIRWCVKSEPELKKCKALAKTCGSASMSLNCVVKVSTDDCIKAISEGTADACTLDSSEVYKASLHPYNLKPVAAENYGAKDQDTCYYSVAVVSKSSDFQFKDLKGKRTCHTGVGRAAGWTSPMGVILAKGLMKWEGPEAQPLEKALAEFVSAACAPGAKEPKLCKQCAGVGDKKCQPSKVEPYYGYDGALQCLKEDKGDVTFLKHILPDDLSKDYELLCTDDRRQPIEGYKDCHLSRIPAHAVVTEDKEDKIKAVTKFLEEAQKKAECKLFSSDLGNDLMFKNSAKGIITLPEKMDAFLYLGQRLSASNKALHIVTDSPPEDTIRWCTQGTEEKAKCDNWSMASKGAIECIEASSAEECITKVLKGEADAVTLDGGYQYTAGKCGLIPVMQEIYDADTCNQRKSEKKGSYYAVAVVKKSNKDITWKNLRNTKSCHTGQGRTAGYNIPAGLIKKETGICDLSTFFMESCIPGADPKSKLCSLCAGNPDKSGDTKCLPNNQEQYYGYTGAIRCLIKKGDVAFVKHTTIPDLYKSESVPSWTGNLKESDFELLCLDGTRQPIGNYENCNLASVPSHAVVALPERKQVVLSILKGQEQSFGRKGNNKEQFQMFTSEGPRDQLFKDSTQCLRQVQESNMKDFLGEQYHDAVTSLNECGKTGLLAACTFHTCRL
ncbi:serotransferrin-A-like [Gastrophryne carolinensis]